MWTEKYRPVRPKDIAGLVSRLKTLIEDKENYVRFPHLLIYSKFPGTGKTTTARIIVKELGCDCLTLNASDERGIDTVRTKIKAFAMTMSSVKGKFKIIHLDEFDMTTKEYQTSLRNLMETYHKNCRFILTANYVNKIIDPIKSRCTLFDFSQPEKEKIIDRLLFIVGEEKVQIGLDTTRKLVDKYYPDIRKMVSKLQELSTLGRGITEEDIGKEEIIAESIMDLLSTSDLPQARNQALNATVEPEVLLEEIYNHIWSGDYTVIQKIKLVRALADSYKWLSMVINKRIMIDSFLIEALKIFNETK